MSTDHRLHSHPNLEEDVASDISDSFSQASIPSRLSKTSSRTSFDYEPSPEPSPSRSVTSLTPSMREQAYKTQYGRAINNFSDVYGLPADEEELARLDGQHIFLADVMGRYPPPVPEILAQDHSTIAKGVLDLGCGSGAWILDVARDFPHVDCVAVDLVPMPTLMPPNCRSEVDDINLGLAHFYDRFNVVHARFISSGIKDYRQLIRQISHVLRPGGLIELIEFDYEVYDANKNLAKFDPASSAPSSLARWLLFMKRALKRRGADIDAATRLREWIVRTGAFKDVVFRKFWLPTCPWMCGNDPQAVWLRSVGDAVRDDILSFLKSGRPLLLSSGLSEDLVNTLEGDARNEIASCSHEGYFAIHSVYAIKRHSSQLI